MECWLLNAQHLRNVPGRKTDVRDAEWITQLIEHGLVRPSFVPPKPIRELRWGSPFNRSCPGQDPCVTPGARRGSDRSRRRLLPPSQRPRKDSNKAHPPTQQARLSRDPRSGGCRMTGRFGDFHLSQHGLLAIVLITSYAPIIGKIGIKGETYGDSRIDMVRARPQEMEERRMRRITRVAVPISLMIGLFLGAGAGAAHATAGDVLYDCAGHLAGDPLWIPFYCALYGGPDAVETAQGIVRAPTMISLLDGHGTPLPPVAPTTKDVSVPSLGPACLAVIQYGVKGGTLTITTPGTLTITTPGTTGGEVGVGQTQVGINNGLPDVRPGEPSAEPPTLSSPAVGGTPPAPILRANCS